MRYNPKSMFMLNRDMLKRDLFFVFGAAVLFDIYAAVRGGGRELTIGLIVTAAAAIALILFFVLTKPKRLIPDALIDSAESFEYVIPADATKRMIEPDCFLLSAIIASCSMILCFTFLSP